MIKGDDILLRYPDGTVALKNFDIEVNSNEVLYIIGPSGSGKTSFLKLLMGMEYPTAGNLEVLGLQMNKKNRGKIRELRRMIGPVFQECNLINGRTSLENVMMGMRFLGIKPKLIKEKAVEALFNVGLGHKINSKVENLSLGERQRVSIARAVVRNPKLILADEPTANLDKENAKKILDLLEAYKNEERAIIITTHAVDLIEDRDDIRLIEMFKGEIIQEKIGAV